MNVLVSLVGLVIYAHFADIGCDPLRSHLISNSNQVWSLHLSLWLTVCSNLHQILFVLIASNVQQT